MDAPFLLLLVSLLLAALGLLGRVAPRLAARWLPWARAALCGLGALLALGADGSVGLLAAVDGLSRVFLVALFLLGAAGWQGPLVLGTAALAVLAANAVLLVAGVGLAAVAAVFVAHAPARRLYPEIDRSTALRLVVVAVLCLLAALLLQGRLGMQFTDIRALPDEGLRGALLIASVLAAAGTLAVALPAGLAGLLGTYLLARLLLDLPGPGTPGWWGVPVLAAGVGCAATAAWQAASAPTLQRAADAAGLAANGLATAGLGAALLARGADLLPASSLGVSGALLAVLAWSVWGGALHLGMRSVAGTVGGTELARLGGLARRAPWMAVTLAAGLLSMAAVPFSAGFAALWAVAQAVFAAGRAGGAGGVLAAAAATAGLGLAVALGTAAALRLARTVLLGTPRSAKAAAMADPPRPVRLAAAAYAALALLIGVLPGPVLLFVQPGVRLLAGGPADGVGTLSVAATPDAPGYAAPVLALVLATALAFVSAGRGRVTRGGPAWTGGFDPAALPQNTGPTPFLPRWPAQARHGAAPATILTMLALVLAALLGWAAGR